MSTSSACSKQVKDVGAGVYKLKPTENRKGNTMAVSEAEAREILSELLSQLAAGIQSEVPVVDAGDGTQYVLSRAHSEELNVVVLAVLSGGSPAETEDLANEIAALLQKPE